MYLIFVCMYTEQYLQIVYCGSRCANGKDSHAPRMSHHKSRRCFADDGQGVDYRFLAKPVGIRDDHFHTGDFGTVLFHRQYVDSSAVCTHDELRWRVRAVVVIPC
jgi:hypothetical protein